MTYNPDINDLPYHLHSILDKYGNVTIHKGDPMKFSESQEEKVVFSVIVMNDINLRRSCTASDLLTSLKGIMVDFDGEA